MRIAFVFPGQGSQSVGMLAGYAGNAAVEDTMKRASAALGQDLQALIAEGPAETLGLTVNTQPVLLATSVAFWNAWRAAGGPVPAVMAGHSLGEYSALCAAGAFSLEDGVKLVRFRAEAMQSAVPVGVGGMAAIIGLSDADVLAACREAASEGGVVEAVNFNSPGQVVIAGEKAALERAVEAAKAKWEQEMQEHREIVDENKVAEVIAMMSGVPVQRIAKAENLKLLEMAEILKKKVIGQDEAVNKVVKAIQRNRIGLKDPNKPIGTFMFLGPTGVGKTYLAKKLAEYLFDSAEALIRIDMSEFLEKFAVSRLVGAPPGYVGYEEGGQLTEKVRRKPYSVVLLDEIEKAHPDVFNLLLQVLDEGHLTDSLGRKIDFKNTILIMTSNIGTRQLKDFGRGIGFNSVAAGEPDKEYSRSVIQKALNKAFSPEFINRIDDIIMFDQLSKESIHQIIDLELESLYQRVENLGYKLSITDAAKEFIATKGYDVQFGARPLKRAIQKYIEDEMAEIIIKTSLSEGDEIKVDFDTEQQQIKASVTSRI